MLLEIFLDVFEHEFRSHSKVLKCVCISEVHHNCAESLKNQNYFPFLRLYCFVVMELNLVNLKNKKLSS